VNLRRAEPELTHHRPLCPGLRARSFDRRASARAFCVVAAWIGVLASCANQAAEQGRSEPNDGSSSRREALLGAFADCAVSKTSDFVGIATALVDATMSHDSSRTPETLARARAAWESAIDRWQQLELFQFGPAAMSTAPGGRELRSQIYVWPQFNRCLIEQLMANGAPQEAFGEQFANARGLGALEYVLFYEGEDNACPPGNPLNAGGIWSSLVSRDLPAAKAGYARTAARDVLRNAEALAAAWDPARENFRSELTGAGRGSRVYPAARDALNAVSDALLYVETDVKDMKLAAPLGLSNCGAPTCPQLVESPFAGRSKVNVRQNLLGMRQLMSGCADGEGLGFDDLLVDIGQTSLSAALAQAIDGSIMALEAIEEPSLELALVSDVDSVRALHTAVKSITDLLKTEFITVLDLELPMRLEGDND
jgi:predicted lipoprotein